MTPPGKPKSVQCLCDSTYCPIHGGDYKPPQSVSGSVAGAQGDAQKQELVTEQTRAGFSEWSAEVDAAFSPSYLQGAEHGWFAALRMLEENLRVAGADAKPDKKEEADLEKPEPPSEHVEAIRQKEQSKCCGVPVKAQYICEWCCKPCEVISVSSSPAATDAEQEILSGGGDGKSRRCPSDSGQKSIGFAASDSGASPAQMICRCGHWHDKHTKLSKLNPNITAGPCSIKGCGCKYFVIADAEQETQALGLKEPHNAGNEPMTEGH